MTDFLEEFTSAPENAAFDHIPIKPIDGVTFARQVPDACYACPLSNLTHQCFKRIGVLDAGRSALVHSAVADRNAMAEWLRRFQALVSWMHIGSFGISNYNDTNVMESPSRNMSVTAAYDLVSAGSTLTLRRGAGDPDPIQFYSNGQVATGASIPPMGVATFGYPSLLRGHGGFRFYRLDLQGRTSVPVGGTFQVHLDGSASAAATKYPSDAEGQIRCGLSFYDVVEQWIEPADYYPFWVSDAWSENVAELIEIQMASGNWMIANGQISWPGANNEYFQCLISKDGQHWDDVTNVALNYLEINNTASWFRFNFSAEADALTWINDGYTLVKYRWRNYDAAGWRISGSRQCARCKRDYSGSYGNFYCAVGPSAASGYANFTDHCCQMGCSGFLPDAPANYASFSYVVAQLLHSVPWRAFWFLNAAIAQRWGCPSLHSLTGNMPDVPVGPAHARFYYDDIGGWNGAGWPQLGIGQTVWDRWGLCVLRGGGSLIGDPDTWQAKGPAARNTKCDWMNETLNDENDPFEVGRCMPMRSMDDVHAHWGYMIPNFGYYQSFRQARLHCPRLVGDTVAGPNFIYQRGKWNANLEPVESDLDAVYFWRVRILRGLLPDKTLDTDPGGTLYSDIVVEQSNYESGTLALDLRNRKIRASTITSPGMEYETEWLSGGTNVPVREDLRMINWEHDGALVGPQRNLIWPGMCAMIRGKRFWIARTKAMGGSTSSWIPYDFANANKIHPIAPCVVWLPFDDQTGAEWATSVHVTDILYDPTVWTDDGQKAYPSQDAVDGTLAMNHFCWENVTIGGVKGVAVTFSQKNMVENNFWRVVHVYITTNGSTRVGDTIEYEGEEGPVYNDNFTVDLKMHAAWGSDNALPITISVMGIPTSVDSVTVTTRRIIDGEPEVHALHPVIYGGFPDLANFDCHGYHAEIIGTQIKLIVHSQWACETVSVKYTLQAGADEAQFWHDNISMHPLPADYGYNESYPWAPMGNKRDQIFVVDEEGLLQAAGDLSSESVQITYDGKASSERPTIAVNSYGETDARILNDFAWLGAEGEIWGRSPLPNDSCLEIIFLAADRNCFRGAQELNDLKHTLDAIMG